MLLGVIAPRVKVAAGAVVGFATLADTPLADTTEKVETVPPDEVILTSQIPAAAWLSVAN
jgi:hypothetical protein